MAKGGFDGEPLIRLVGRSGSGRSAYAVAQAERILREQSNRQLLIFDTLGHGYAEKLGELSLGGRTMFRSETLAKDVHAIGRHLISSGAVGCVIVDDVPGLDFGFDQDRTGRSKALASLSHSLGCLALAHNCSVILIERASEFRTERAPLGFRDFFVSDLAA